MNFSLKVLEKFLVFFTFLPISVNFRRDHEVRLFFLNVETFTLATTSYCSRCSDNDYFYFDPPLHLFCFVLILCEHL